MVFIYENTQELHMRNIAEDSRVQYYLVSIDSPQIHFAEIPRNSELNQASRQNLLR
jgi:hypothetical protein